MKKILLSFVAFVFATVCLAQQQLVATLTHGEEISMFYGGYAYRDAMAAAVDGDVINLSSGRFQACTINKAVSIRGAGVLAEMPTFIVGDFDINISSNATSRLAMEGCDVLNKITLKDTLNNAYFIKNKFYRLNFDRTANTKNLAVANCQISSAWLENGVVQVQFLNSFVNDIRIANAGTSVAFVNCVIVPHNGGGETHVEKIENSVLLNSIVVSPYKGQYYWKIPSTTEVNNCIYVDFRDNPFVNASVSQNNKAGDIAIFTDSDYMKDLTDEAKATYLGTDGTPVGMYGGPMPFDLTPTYPQITKMNVASKTTADGKLSVDIEVSAAQ